MRRLTALLLVLAAGAVTLASGRGLERLSAGRTTETSLLYLPNGQHLKLASLGQAPLLADLIYLWAIQYYSVYEREDRFRYVEHVFGNVIAELDPHYVDAYWMGALILIVEAHDVEAGLRLLDQGIDNNPADWVLPYLAGWESYHAGQPDRAERYFRRAQETPGAPVWVQRYRIGMAAKAGDLRRAVQMWLQVLDDPASDRRQRRIARRQLRHLKVRLDSEALEQLATKFRKQNGRNPQSLAELRARGYIRSLPRDPYGRDYSYDPTTGRVTAGEARILGADR